MTEAQKKIFFISSKDGLVLNYRYLGFSKVQYCILELHTCKFMQHWLNWGRKEYMFQYLLSTIVLDFMGFSFHKKDKFDVVKVTIEEG